MQLILVDALGTKPKWGRRIRLPKHGLEVGISGP